MALVVPAGNDAAASVALNECLTRGGVAVARVQILAPGTYWLAPQDSRRVYIGFSLSIPANGCTVSPGDDNQPYGYTLHSGESIIEFGGLLLAPLVNGIWHVAAAAPADLDVTVIRSL